MYSIPYFLEQVFDRNPIESFLILIFSIIISLSVNQIFFHKLINGLFNFQVNFIFNLAVAIKMLAINMIIVEDFFHFLIVEFVCTALTIFTYKKVIRKGTLIVDSLDKYSNVRTTTLIIVFAWVMAIISLIFVPSDGSSRIEYQTNWWFAFLRIPMSILFPLGYLQSNYFFRKQKYVYSLLLVISLILSSVLSGSKASYVLSILTSYFLYNDLSGDYLKLSSKTLEKNSSKPIIFAGVIGLSWSVSATLERLKVDSAEMLSRLILSGEANIMIYASSQPTAACENISMLAAIHRGFARLFQDPSAVDVGTLFGFAVSRIEYGGDSFTGPNANLPAYIRCNFPGMFICIGLLSILAYFFIIGGYLNYIASTSKFMLYFFSPLLVSSINNYTQDYNIGASDVTLIFIAFIASKFLKLSSPLHKQKSL